MKIPLYPKSVTKLMLQTVYFHKNGSKFGHPLWLRNNHNNKSLVPSVPTKNKKGAAK
jgi:hypothetical protein